MQIFLVFLLFVGVYEGTFGQECTSEKTIKNFFQEIGTHTFTNAVGRRQLKTYYISRSVRLSWANAFSFCKANDMNLVELHTKEEADEFLTMCGTSAVEAWYHIGGSSEGMAKRGDYYWMTTGENLTYALEYLPGQPDNYGAFANYFGRRQIKTYYITRTVRLSWANALSFCKANDMNLVELHTKQEADNFLTIMRTSAPETLYYIGGSAEGMSNRLDYYWMTTGEQIPFTLEYSPGQPDNYGGKERCLSISKQPGKFKFNDIACSENNYGFFACQHLKDI
ncbi:unnamed protein product [Diamesa hyperborea]